MSKDEIKISEDQRKELADLADEIELMVVELNHKKTGMQVRLATILKGAGASVKDHAVCLLCGNVFVSGRACDCKK